MSLRIATNTVDALLDQYQRDLATLYPRAEVRAIACAVFHDRLGWDATDLMVKRSDALSESELLQVYLPLKRLRTGEPLQYVLGAVDFHGLRIAVDPAVLIPRPETEELVDLVIRSREQAPRRIVDVGTGSGCIALGLKKAFPLAEVTGLDVSDDALRVARANAEGNALAVHWAKADVLDEGFHLPAGTDLVVSNPPYIPRSEEADLAANVRDHEPHLALFVEDADPLRFFRVIAEEARRTMGDGGDLWFEGHHLHASEVGKLLEDLGYRRVRVLNDLGGSPRFIHASR